MSLHQQLQLQSQVNANLLQFLSTQQGDWASYKALPSEINLDPAVEKAKSLNWYFPRVRENELEFFSRAAGFVTGSFGILEPLADVKFQIPINKLQGILVPGLGFDKQGHRLGKGKGYYDRALRTFPGIRVGVTFETLMLESLPKDQWDIPMDILITETGIKYMSKRD